MSEPVKIVIVVEGGIVQSVLTAGVPVDCIVIDHDTDGCEPGELSDPAGIGLAHVYREDVFDDPASRKTVMLAHENTPDSRAPDPITEANERGDFTAYDAAYGNEAPGLRD